LGGGALEKATQRRTGRKKGLRFEQEGMTQLVKV